MKREPIPVTFYGKTYPSRYAFVKGLGIPVQHYAWIANLLRNGYSPETSIYLYAARPDIPAARKQRLWKLGPANDED